MVSFNEITTSELHSLYQSDPNIHVVDVRSPAEYETVHATMAQSAPLEKIDDFLGNQSDRQSPIYMICKMGGRSSQACEKLVSAGHTNVHNVAGGTEAWVAAGLPVVRGQQTMAIDRQVRILAGSLVALGAALSWFHPAFVLLSAFIGCGLVFSGVTDTCGMAAVIAKMPWNQVKSKAKATSLPTTAAASCDTGG